jgi:putative tricarboxylic transport membrane protein
MDTIHEMLVALQPGNLLFVFIGVVIGTVIGLLPGLGPTATIALLLPITYRLEPVTAVIMLAGIYYGAMYGGTITSVLLRIPGEAASVVTTFDGYQMARRGRAGPALGIAAIGSFIGGTVAIVGMMVLAPQLSKISVTFGPPEYAALALLGIALVGYLSIGNLLKAFIAAAAGLFFVTIGQDPIVGSARFTFGFNDLFGGLDFVAVCMGLFGVGEMLHSLDHRSKGETVTTKVGRVWPGRQDLRASRGPIARGSLIGFGIGLLPGGGGIVSSLTSYAVEKRVSKHPQEFGRGAIEGVAGPETANNAGSTSAFVPLLTLGLPSNPVLALMFGALLLQGITPGPRLITDHPDIFWGVIGSMYIGNIMLIILNLPLVFVFIQILKIRADILVPIALVVTLVGVYSINNNVFDVWVAVVFGVIGYLMRKTEFDLGAFVLAFVLGGILEGSVRQSLLLGDASIFVTRPYSGGMIAIIAIITVLHFVSGFRKRRASTLHATQGIGQ